MTTQSRIILLLQAFIAALLLTSATAKQYKCRQIVDGGKMKQVCQQICPDDCLNGVCNVSAGQCVCKTGTHMENNKCMPDCHAGCPEHAECISGGNSCRCKTAYRSGDDGKCVPSCSPECDQTQYCEAFNTCRCKEGYLTTKAGCEPVCQKGCGEHGRCVAPNKCQCLEGYAEAGSSNGFIKCLPVCDMAASQCENAACVSPGKCECRTGFTRKTENGKCEPVCAQGCGEHGVCVAPERCGCVAGYQRVDAVCVPKCDKPCAANEYCYEPNLCRCAQGYEKQPSADTGNDCTPICAQGCAINAFCVAPGKCNCYMGYAMQTDGNCTPICRRACTGNSTCVAPDICLCNIGFTELRGICVPEAHTEAAIAEKTCLKEMNLLLVRIHVACDTGPFAIYLLYGLLMGLLVVCAVVSYQGYQNCRRHFRKKPATQAPVDYVITYQASSESADAEMASTSQRARPPSYNSLPRKR